MTCLAVLLLAISTPAFAAAEQGASCQRPLASLVVPQRGYVQVNVASFEQRVYLYAPDIKSGLVGKDFGPFQLWIVEGVYGKPFVQSSGSLDERAFDQIRQSQNVKATPIHVERNSGGKRESFAIGKQRFVLELVKVNTSLAGTSSVTVNICR